MNKGWLSTVIYCKNHSKSVLYSYLSSACQSRGRVGPYLCVVLGSQGEVCVRYVYGDLK